MDMPGRAIKRVLGECREKINCFLLLYGLIQ